MNPETNETPPAATEKPRALRHRLSALMRNIPSDECCRILSTFDAAILKGTIKAVPLLGEYFPKTIILENGQKKRATVQDELVLMDEAWEKWFAEQRRESRYQVLNHAGVVATTIDRIKSGEDDFDRLLEIRRRRLKTEQQRGEKS